MASQDSHTAANVLECLRDLLFDLPGIFAELDQNLFNTNSEEFLQCMERRANELCYILSVVNADLVGLNIQGNLLQIFGDLNSAFEDTVVRAHRYRQRFQELLHWSPLRPNGIDGSQFHLSGDGVGIGTVGKPKIMLSKEQVSVLISLGFKFVEISKMLGVHPKTLRKLRREWDLPVGTNVFSEITDDQLDETIQEIL